MANFYLELATKILRVAQLPLTSREIIARATDLGLLTEPYNRAATPHRTIHARLAKSIRREGERSAFYRFAPGTFGLRANLFSLEYHRLYGKEYRAPIRKKEIASENILCVPRVHFPLDQQDGFFPTDAFRRLVAENRELVYLPRRLAERNYQFKQIVTYVAIIKEGRILCYERGAYSAVENELVGRKSVGFGGHISQQDHNLFSTDAFGVISNAQRELFEETQISLQATTNRASSE